MNVEDAVWAFLTALAITAAGTPLTAVLARRIGAIDSPRPRGLAVHPTPRLGGLAILAGVLVSCIAWLPLDDATRGILLAGVAIAAVGAIDDARGLHPAAKLLGQVAAAVVAVRSGVKVTHITFPFLGPSDLEQASGPLTVIGLVVVMNIVNLSDGIDGLAGGVSAISALTFAALAFDLGRNSAGVLAAVLAGAALGFLAYNLPPARHFMGDGGSNLLGLLLGATAVQGTVKTNALVGLFLPLVILAVPLLDTSFVIAKRVKYRRPIHRADANHFHHRFTRIGFSPWRTLIHLYAWTLAFAGLALAMRFLPYSDHHGHYNATWAIILLAVGLLVLLASVRFVIALEILKFGGLRSRRQEAYPNGTEQLPATEHRELDTGELPAITS